MVSNNLNILGNLAGKRGIATAMDRLSGLMKVSLTAIVMFQIFTFCAPYSLPEKKSYSEKDDPYTFYLRSVEAYNNKEYNIALQNINHAILLNKDMAKFYQMKGEIYKAQSEFTLALAAFDLALGKRSNFIEVHQSMGEIYQIQGKYEDAIRAYKRLTALEPERIDIILRIVECYTEMNEVDVATHNLDLYDKSAAEYKLPLQDKYFLLRGDILYRSKKYQESLRYLQKIKIQGEKSLKLQGLDYFGLENYETGVSYFNKLLNLDKNKAEWYFYRGIYYYQKNDFNDAQAQFNHTLALDPEFSEARYYLGKIYLLNGDKPSALQEFTQYQMQNANSERIEEVNRIIQNLSDQ